MGVTHAYYCSKICGGKCCYVYNKMGRQICSCPKLTEEATCSIYKERYEQGQPFQTAIMCRDGLDNIMIDFKCGYIKDILEKDVLPKEIADQCCYKNPELLEIEND